MAEKRTAEGMKKKMEYNARWKKENTRGVVLHINLSEEAIWNKLRSVPNKTGYILSLIRKDIEESGE